MRYLMLLKATQPADPPPPGAHGGDHASSARRPPRPAPCSTPPGLAPSAAGARVALRRQLSVTDGPFAEAKETISYAVYEVRSKEEAVEWASRFMKLHRDLWEGWEGDSRGAQGLRPGGLRPAPA